MKLTILFIALFASSSLLAQITLNSGNNPSPGDAERIYSCDTNGVSEGNSGANQTWNFSGIVKQDSITFDFVAPGGTPFGSQFPNSNVASTFDNASFSYYTANNSVLRIDGNGLSTGTVVYSNPQDILQYPFSYNSSFTDQFSADFTVSGITVHRSGTTTSTGDGWGTITLPSGTFQNALRVKVQSQSRDSSNPGIPFVIVTNSTSYAWYVAGHKFPVFGVSYTQVDLNGIPQPVSKSVEYTPNTTIGINQIGFNVPEKFTLSQNYPNPFNPSTKINFSIPENTMVKLTVFDALGREVEVLVNESLNSGSYEVDWNASKLTSGVYFYKLEADRFQEVKKMTVVK